MLNANWLLAGWVGDVAVIIGASDYEMERRVEVKEGQRLKPLTWGSPGRKGKATVFIYLVFAMKDSTLTQDLSAGDSCQCLKQNYCFIKQK